MTSSSFHPLYCVHVFFLLYYVFSCLFTTFSLCFTSYLDQIFPFPQSFVCFYKSVSFRVFVHLRSLLNELTLTVLWRSLFVCTQYLLVLLIHHVWGFVVTDRTLFCEFGRVEGKEIKILLYQRYWWRSKSSIIRDYILEEFKESDYKGFHTPHTRVTLPLKFLMYTL